MIDVNDKVSSTLVFSLVTDVTPIIMNDALENTNLPITSSLVTDANDEVSLSSISSLMNDVVPILTNGVLENMDLLMAYILITDTNDKVSSILAFSLVTDVEPVLMNGVLENIDLTLASSLVTNAFATSRFSTTSLFPFSHISLPFTYNCFTGCFIQVIIYHSVLYLRILISQFPPNIFSETYFPCKAFLLFIFR